MSISNKVNISDCLVFIVILDCLRVAIELYDRLLIISSVSFFP